MPITPHESIAGHRFSYNRHERHCGGVVAVMPCQRCLCWSLPFVCVCVLITAVPMKKLFAWGDWCVCVSFNYFALVLSLYSSTGVAAQQVFAAEHSGVSLLGKQSILEPRI